MLTKEKKNNNKIQKEKTGKVLRVALFRSPTANIINNLVTKFEQLNDCHVIIDVYPYELLRQNVITDLSLKNGRYDIFTTDCTWLAEFVESGYLEEIDGFTQDNKLFNERKYEFDDLIKKVDTVQCLYKDKRYGFPLISNIHMLAYRKDLYKKYVEPTGIRLPGKSVKDAWSWKEFISAANVIKENTKMSVASIRAKSPSLVVYNWYPYLFMLASENLELRLRRAIELIGNLYNERLAPETSIVWSHEDPVNWLINDKLAMDQVVNLEMAYWIHNSDISDKIDFAMMPKGEINPRPTLGGFSLGISKLSQNKELAFKFIAWATNPQAHYHIVKEGGTPCRYSELNDKRLLEKYPYFKIFADSLPHASIRPKVANWVNLEVLVAGEIMQFITKQKDIDKVVKAIVKSGTQIIE